MALQEFPADASTDPLPATVGCAVISHADVVEYDGCFLYHRASAVCGMAGGPVRGLEQPQLLYGIHIGGLGAGPSIPTISPFVELPACHQLLMTVVLCYV